MAWLQLAGDRKRFFVALLGITFAVAMMLFQMGLKNALYKQVVGPLELLDGQVVIVGANYEYFGVGKGFPEVRLHQSRAVAEVESAEGIKLGCMSFKSVDDGRERDIFVIAFDPSKEVFLSDDIRGSQEFLKRDGAVLFDSLSRSQYGDVAGKFAAEGSARTEIAGRRATVKGLVRIGATFAARRKRPHEPAHLFRNVAGARRSVQRGGVEAPRRRGSGGCGPQARKNSAARR